MKDLHFDSAVSRQETLSRNLRQTEVLDWAIEIFSYDVAGSPHQRAVRFLEEAVELFQAVYEVHKYDKNHSTVGRLDWFSVLRRRFWMWRYDRKMRRKAIDIVNYVMSRDPGKTGQEIGGVMITLMGVAEIEGKSVASEEMREFRRIMDPMVIEVIKGKQANKVHQ